MSSPQRVGLITGGASGLGLAAVEHLIAKGWNVTIFDFRKDAQKELEARFGNQILFVQGDVSKYKDQTSAFVQTFNKWQRLDLVYANAGIGDRIDFCKPAQETETGAPAEPDISVIDICLTGAVYSAYLAFHFFRKSLAKNGLLVSTASLGGLYPAAAVPIYGSTKHGVVGLTRSLAKRLLAIQDPIRVNCVAPGFMPTPVTPKIMREILPSHVITPVDRVVSALERFIQDPSLSGVVAECSGEHIHYREPVPYLDEAAEYIAEEKYSQLVSKEAMMKHGEFQD